jgi:hypothetical protein
MAVRRLLDRKAIFEWTRHRLASAPENIVFSGGSWRTSSVCG